MKKTAIYVALAALIAALYAVLTIFLWEFSSLAIQVRVSEALTVLPAMFSSAIPGVTIGCVIANLIAGNVIDAIFGSLTTLLAAVLTRILAKKFTGKLSFLLYPLPPVLLNALVIPFILYYGYGITSMGNVTATYGVLGLMALSVFIGEAISCYALGIPLYLALKKVKSLRSAKA